MIKKMELAKILKAGIVNRLRNLKEKINIMREETENREKIQMKLLEIE